MKEDYQKALKKSNLLFLPNPVPFKGNPNYQGILSWIIKVFQLLLQEAIQKYWKLRLLNKILFSLCLSLFTAACASCRFPQWQNFKRHKWSFMPYIYFGFLVEKGFLQVNPARCHCLHKNIVFTITSISIISCLQLLQNIYTNLSLL